jgi:ActR/RegA family two-component response regulator
VECVDDKVRLAGSLGRPVQRRHIPSVIARALRKDLASVDTQRYACLDIHGGADAKPRAIANVELDRQVVWLGYS